MKLTYSNKKIFQSHRVFWLAEGAYSKAGWYYEAREGVFGPFNSQAIAERDLALLIEINPKCRAGEQAIADAWSEPAPAHAVAV